jgi:hypothetical protein
MIKVRFALAWAGVLAVSPVQAISLDDIQLWTGSGTNRAALVIDWNSPEVFNFTTVPAPVATKTMVWGYRFNGAATGTQMLEAIAAADPKLYVVVEDYPGWGTFVDGIGYNLSDNGVIGVTDGTTTSPITNGYLTTVTLDPDASTPLNSGDLFWSGFTGPYWQIWNEVGDAGGFLASPNRGSSAYWDPVAGTQGQWAYAGAGLDGLPLTNGSWIGFSVAPAGYDSNTNDPAYAIGNDDVQAPPSPNGTYVAYVANTNDFAVQVVSSSDLDSGSPYNNPAAVLNRPALKFYDPFGGRVTNRVSVVDDPYNVAPDGSDLITEILNGGQITVQLGRKVYDNPSNPYGIDLIVYGNSFFDSLSGAGLVSDATDLSTATLKSTNMNAHVTSVSVSQDGVNWVAVESVPVLYPDNAYRWDDTNSAWTDEELNPTKPLDPLLYTNNLGGQTIAGVLDQFAGAAGGTGYRLQGTGLPWIQYVRMQPGPTSYTVVDAVAAVNPVVVGDALAIGPDNLAAGVGSLAFQSANDCRQNQISLNFTAVNELAKISTVSLSEFSAFAPVPGSVSAAYQIQARPLGEVNPVVFAATVGLRAGNAYHGAGNDLRVFQWGGRNWSQVPFTFSAADNEVQVAGVTNFSAFVISQLVPPRLSVAAAGSGFAVQFVPVPNCMHILERSSDLVTWTPILTNTPAGPAPVILEDTRAPASQAFYRLVVETP